MALDPLILTFSGVGVLVILLVVFLTVGRRSVRIGGRNGARKLFDELEGFGFQPNFLVVSTSDKLAIAADSRRGLVRALYVHGAHYVSAPLTPGVVERAEVFGPKNKRTGFILKLRDVGIPRELRIDFHAKEPEESVDRWLSFLNVPAHVVKR